MWLKSLSERMGCVGVPGLGVYGVHHSKRSLAPQWGRRGEGVGVRSVRYGSGFTIGCEEEREGGDTKQGDGETELIWEGEFRALGRLSGRMGGVVARVLSMSEGVKKETLDGCGNGNVREDPVGVAKDASGWAICRVVLTRYVLSAKVKLPREGLYEGVDPFENFVDR